ncbi:MAG: hypothetical protein R6W77_05215 [Trueperaceae bacterium]
MGEFDKRYLLRVWSSEVGRHVPRPNLLASLRDVEDGKVRTFDDLDDLVRYLVSTAGGGDERA